MTERAWRCGWIGLGAMGAPMARNLAQAGCLAAVWNRTLSKAEAFARDTEVAVAENPADLARRCNVIFTCVSADEDLLEVIEALSPGLERGDVLVDVSTVAADTARRVAQRVAEHDAAFLDAPVSGGVEGAKAGTLAMMVGGEADTLERVRPILEAMASRVAHMGPAGAGQATKAVNQIIAAGINQAVTEGLAFAQAEGLPLDDVIEVVGAGAAGNWFLRQRGPTMVRGEFVPGFKVALHDKDLGICQQMALAHGVQLPVVAMTRVHYRRLIEGGHGDDDISSLFLEKQRLFEEPEAH